MRHDILYCEGPGDIEASYASWQRGDDFRSETSVTFSSQVFQFCQAHRLSLYAVSYCPRAARLSDKSWTIENKPRREFRWPLIGYHLGLLLYALRLLVLAWRVRPQVILICSGVVGWTFACVLKLSGARLVPVLHNALWPVGHPGNGVRQSLQDGVHRLFWRSCVWQTLAVSPALKSQVEQVAGPDVAANVRVFQPSFSRAFFGDAPPAADFSARPFRILYVGRIEQNKGVLDLVEIAAALLESDPNGFHFDVCGDGSALALLSERVKARGLAQHITLWGRLDRPRLSERYLAAHAVIVPTRTNFTEGFAMVVAEAILHLKPVVTSPVVPASQTFAQAVLLARPDDVQSYVAALRRLSGDRALFEELVGQARRLRSTVFEEHHSFLVALRTLLASPPIVAVGESELDEAMENSVNPPD